MSLRSPLLAAQSLRCVAVRSDDANDGAVLTVDPSAVVENVRRLASVTPGEIMAVVKADGFGLGAETVARAALRGGATSLGTTSIREAVSLRRAGIVGVPILSWLNAPGVGLHEAAADHIELAIPSLRHLHAATASGTNLKVHLHLDTGMARDGAPCSEWQELCRAAAWAERTGRLRVVGLMGHLPRPAEPSSAASRRSRAVFAWGASVARNAGLTPQHLHLASTAATVADPDSHFTMSRIGAGLVGIDPSQTLPLRSPLTLTAPLVSVRTVAPGTPVGYDGTWVTSRTTRLGLLPLGYADGLPRCTSGRAQVMVAGARRPIVGRVSMDSVIVDLGSLPARPGDMAILMGPGDAGEPTIHDWARWADTIAHEIVTGLSGARATRRITQRERPTSP